MTHSMKRVYIMPLLVAGLFAAACGGGLTDLNTPPRVRFVNVTTGMSGNGGFTTNGQFVSGSALAFGQTAQACATVDPVTTSFGFGTVNGGGTALSGNALATLNNQAVAAGGNYTMVATGSAASPQLYLIDNRFAGALGSNQAAVRFLNLAPGPNPIPNIFAVFNAWPPLTDGAVVAPGVLVGTPSEFKIMASGPITFSFLIGHQIETLESNAVTLQAGTVNTFAIVPKTSGGYQLINIPQC
jgi:hypothetical protein